jgi:hypothetical protein
MRATRWISPLKSPREIGEELFHHLPGRPIHEPLPQSRHWSVTDDSHGGVNVVTAAPNVIADAVRAQTLTGSGGSNVFVFDNLGFGHAAGLSAAS